ncbi:MAG: hypothetical protein ACRC7N_13305 [Clostridium sp.]
MAKSTNEKEVSKKKVTVLKPRVVIKNEAYYQLLIASFKDMIGANICINHLMKNGIRATLGEWNGSYMVLSNKFGFKQFALREKERVEELKYKPTFI